MWQAFFPSPSFSCLLFHRGWDGAPDEWAATMAYQLPLGDSAHSGEFPITEHHSRWLSLLLLVWGWLPLQGRLSWPLWPSKGRIRPLRLWLLFAYPVLLEVLEETGQSCPDFMMGWEEENERPEKGKDAMWWIIILGASISLFLSCSLSHYHSLTHSLSDSSLSLSDSLSLCLHGQPSVHGIHRADWEIHELDPACNLLYIY